MTHQPSASEMLDESRELTYPDPPAQLRKRMTLTAALSVLGPGAIVGSANMVMRSATGPGS